MYFRACLQSLGVTTAVLIGVQFMPLLATRAEAAERFVILGPIAAHEGGETPDLVEFRKSRFDADLLTGAGGEAALEAREDSVVKIAGKEFQWTPGMTNDGVVDLDKTLGRHEWSVAYAYANVESDEAKQIILGLGSDDST